LTGVFALMPHRRMARKLRVEYPAETATSPFSTTSTTALVGVLEYLLPGGGPAVLRLPDMWA
jgi:hypothetical protein